MIYANDVVNQTKKACILQSNGYQIIDLVCTNKTGDHDSVRPLIGTQYRFMVRLIDLKEKTNGGIF